MKGRDALRRTPPGTTPPAPPPKYDGFVFSGLSPDGKLVEVIELPGHPFFIASQFHPEFQSKPHQPHPLFKGFIAAAHQNIHNKPL